MKTLHPGLALLVLVPLLASCGTPTRQGFGGTSGSCTPPPLAGSIVRVELSDAGGRSMGGGGMHGAGLGTMGDQAGSMMSMAMRIDRGSVPSDQPVSFIAHNAGSLVHELLILPLPADTPAGSIRVGSNQRANESASRGEASKPCGGGAGDGLTSDATGWVTVTLPRGTYALICNHPGHYSSGMWAEFVVR